MCIRDSSDTLRKLLEGVVAEGSGKNAKVEGYAIGGKTATSVSYTHLDVYKRQGVACYVAKKSGQNPDTYFDLALVAIICSVIGARIRCV